MFLIGMTALFFVIFFLVYVYGHYVGRRRGLEATIMTTITSEELFNVIVSQRKEYLDWKKKEAEAPLNDVSKGKD